MSDMTAVARQAISHLGAVIDGLSPADLDRRTPCSDWTVAEVLAHLTGTAEALTVLARTGERTLPDTVVVPPDPIAATHRSLLVLDTAIADHDTAPDRAARAAGDAAVECTVHAWDLDPTRDLPDGLADEVLRFVAPLVDDAVRDRFFGPEVTVGPDTAPGARLVAHLGRQPR